MRLLQNMRECLKPRQVSKAESGFGAILPRYTTDIDLGVRYFQTSARSDFGKKEQPHSTMTSEGGEVGGTESSTRMHCGHSHHPSNPHPTTVEECNKGTVEDVGAGFCYEQSMSFNPIPFPSRVGFCLCVFVSNSLHDKTHSGNIRL